jgi:DNA-binding transcriptional LysR family regulator
MSTLPPLDPDLLRVFVLIAEGRSFTRAAEVVGRTQSAVSMQIRRLEETLGQPVLLRSKGANVELTTHGEYLLARAREILALSDEVMATFRTPALAGCVRLGVPDDYAFGFLPPILRRFADSHPSVDVEVSCSPSEDLVGQVRAGALDLALVSEGHEPRHWNARPIWRGKLAWVTSARYAPHLKTPLPLALAGERASGTCTWRIAALQALSRAGRRYRIAYTSETQAGTYVPVMAGLAVTLSSLSWLPEELRAMRPDEGMPPLPDFGIVLLKAAHPRQPVTDALIAQIEAGSQAGAAAERMLAVA